MSLRTIARTFLFTLATAIAVSAAPLETDVYVSGADGYHTYRIPAIVKSRAGTLLAFAEGRKTGRGDAGNIDLLVKRSTDGGKTWGKQILVWDEADNTAGNPCPVVDEKTGAIILLSTHNLGTDKETDIINKRSKSTRTVWVLRSEDDGLTWSKATEITATTKDPSWGWYATGPGNGIQLQKGPHAGRLVIPANHSFDDPNGTLRGGKYSHRAHAIYSDDGGKTWKLGGNTGAGTNESQIVELAEPAGGLLDNMRSYFGRSQRTHSISKDGGLTWTTPEDQPTLVEPVCQASIIRQSFPSAGKPGLILFSNPADPKARVKMTVRGSTDDGKTWPTKLVLTASHAAYSSLVAVDANTAACLYERGEKGPYEKIVLASFSTSDLK